MGIKILQPTTIQGLKGDEDQFKGGCIRNGVEKMAIIIGKADL
jgi:hypothetical protein